MIVPGMQLLMTRCLPASYICLWTRINLFMEREVSSLKEHTKEYTIDTRPIYDMLYQICKDTDLYLYVKQHKSKRGGRGEFYAIHSMWLGPNHVNSTTTEAEAAFQMLVYNGEEMTWNWEKYVSWYVEYHIILDNFKEYGYRHINSGTKVHHLLNGIRCDKLFIVIALVGAYPGKYGKDFGVTVTYLLQ